MALPRHAEAGNDRETALGFNGDMQVARRAAFEEHHTMPPDHHHDACHDAHRAAHRDAHRAAQHDLGLAHDLHHLQSLHRGLTRRRLALGVLGGLGSTLAGAPGLALGQPAACPVVPDETAGPFPANGAGWGRAASVNALVLAGVRRSDIRPNFAGVAGVAGGVPMLLTLQLADTGAACAALSSLVVYLWQCDREGRYSLYSSGVQQQNYLRGVQTAGADGSVRFTTVVPGCYDGRMPHLHFEVYRSMDAAGVPAQRIKTSQIALPTAACMAVYQQAEGYADSVRNMGRISFARDMVFQDGVELQMASLSGSVQAGFVALLTVGLKV